MVESATPYLLVATPCYGGQVNVKYLTSVLALQREMDKRGLKVEFVHLSNSALITQARNRLVAQFLNDADATHLLFIDADQGFNPDQVFRLLLFGTEVSAAVSPKKIMNWSKIERAVREGRSPDVAGLDYVVNFKGEDGQVNVRNGFAQASAIGTGFMLITRSALIRLREAYPELRSWVDDADRESGNYYGFFDCMIEPKTGASLSEDLAFCKRWSDIGGEIWVDTQSKLSHTGPTTYYGDLSTQFRLDGGGS
jgi:hypothetical protein